MTHLLLLGVNAGWAGLAYLYLFHHGRLPIAAALHALVG